MTAMRVDLAAMAQRRRRRPFIEQKAVIGGDHEALHSGFTEQVPGGAKTLQHPIEDIKPHPFFAGIIDLLAVDDHQLGLGD
jgi:hypothetical protein